MACRTWREAIVREMSGQNERFPEDALAMTLPPYELDRLVDPRVSFYLWTKETVYFGTGRFSDPLSSVSRHPFEWGVVYRPTDGEHPWEQSPTLQVDRLLESFPHLRRGTLKEGNDEAVCGE